MGRRYSSKWARKQIRRFLYKERGKSSKGIAFIRHSRHRIGLRCADISRKLRKIEKRVRSQRGTFVGCGGGRERTDIHIDGHTLRVILRQHPRGIVIISVYTVKEFSDFASHF